MKTIKEQLACARRELALRRNVYPGWVARGKMNQQKSDHEIACMESIVETLTVLTGMPLERDLLLGGGPEPGPDPG